MPEQVVKKAVNNVDTETGSLRHSIARLSIRIAASIGPASDEDRLVINCALTLLTQAQVVAKSEPQDARMLYSRARQLFSTAR